MPRLPDLFVPNRDKMREEYRIAHAERLAEGKRNVRLIGNPKGAEAVAEVIEQIPGVKADLRRARPND